MVIVREMEGRNAYLFFQVPLPPGERFRIRATELVECSGIVGILVRGIRAFPTALIPNPSPRVLGEGDAPH